MKIIGISGSPTAASRSSWLLQHFLGTLAAQLQRRLPPVLSRQAVPAVITPLAKRTAPQHPLPRGVRISA